MKKMKHNSEIGKELQPAYAAIERFFTKEGEDWFVLRNADEWETYKAYTRQGPAYHQASVYGAPEEYPCLATSRYIPNDCRADVVEYEFLCVDDAIGILYVLKTPPRERKEQSV